MLRKSLILRRLEKASNRARTDDLLITNQLLYQLSYAGDEFFISHGWRLWASGFNTRLGLIFSKSAGLLELWL